MCRYWLILLCAVITMPLSASVLDCISINQNVAQMQQAAEQGTYRRALHSNMPAFDYASQASFSDYLRHTREYILARNPRALWPCSLPSETLRLQGIEREKAKVIDFIAPYELRHANNERVVLLVHGLTDSPFSFHDMASDLFHMGFDVRVMLLPGHAQAPSAMASVRYEQWQAALGYALAQSQKDYKQVVLGGYSTGASLVLRQLLKPEANLQNVAGVVLWSPSIKAVNSLAWLSPLMNMQPFVTWLEKHPDSDFAKYESFTLNEAAQVQKLMRALKRERKEARWPELPMMMLVAGDDQTTRADESLALFKTWHQAKTAEAAAHDKLLYFGETPLVLVGVDKHVVQHLHCEGEAHCAQSVGAAHALVGSPENPHYGVNGAYRSCFHYSEDEAKFAACKQSASLIYAEKTPENLARFELMARLMFNPAYKAMMSELEPFLQHVFNVQAP